MKVAEEHLLEQRAIYEKDPEKKKALYKELKLKLSSKMYKVTEAYDSDFKS